MSASCRWMPWLPDLVLGFTNYLRSKCFGEGSRKTQLSHLWTMSCYDLSVILVRSLVIELYRRSEMTTFAIRFNVRTSRASERRAELAPAMPNAAKNGQSQCFCFIFDVDLEWLDIGRETLCPFSRCCPIRCKWLSLHWKQNPIAWRVRGYRDSTLQR